MLYTIGHYNHSLEKFLELLRAHTITTLVDVRSWPSSRHLPHFNRLLIQRALANAEVTYLWFGKELGGKAHCDTVSPIFQNYTHDLATLSEDNQVAIMCAEENPLRCHHKHLLAEPLTAEGVQVVHILGDGSLAKDRNDQLPLFKEANSLCRSA